MHHAHLALSSKALYRPADFAANSREFSVHLLPELQNLPGELLDPRGQLFKNRHSLFQSFYPRVKSLRLHDISIQAPGVDT